MIKASFDPVVDARTRILVLGSLPGDMSLRRAEYYGNPRNQFWALMEAVLATELTTLPYAARLARLLRAGVGLWDVIRSATRAGSLDAAIRDHRPNALAQLAASLPDLRLVAFNGGKAGLIGRKQLPPGFAPDLVTLPSSSPAHTLAFAAKRAAWLRLRAALDTTG